MIVVTRNPEFQAEGCLIAHSLGEALELARQAGESEVFIIGGGEIFAQALGLAERMYLTQVHATTEADVFFPEFDRDDWIEIKSEEQQAGERNDHPTTFLILTRGGDRLASSLS
jgi:dihydrofolate reductase